MMTSIAGVYELVLVNTKVFVLQGKQTVLIDTGLAPMPDEVLAFLEKTGFAFASEADRKLMQEGSASRIIDFLEKNKLTVEAIICTHFHSDHTGNLKKLRDTLKVPVAVHADDVAFVEGQELPPPPAFIPPEILKHLTVEFCSVDRILSDGEFFNEDLQVIQVSGHTRGSICLDFKNQALIAGDCVVGRNTANPQLGRDALNPPMEPYCMDYKQAVKSLQKLLQYNFTALLPSHGLSIWENGKEELQKLCSELANRSITC